MIEKIKQSKGTDLRLVSWIRVQAGKRIIVKSCLIREYWEAVHLNWLLLGIISSVCKLSACCINMYALLTDYVPYNRTYKNII